MAYSKSEVNRAGVRLVGQLDRFAMGAGGGAQELSEFERAVEVIDWWRGEHAKPLSRVAANLRYYAGEEGKPIVAQRLKKFPTIIDKLRREPAMKLSRMGDIGGVRAVLPDQKAAYKVAGRLRRNWTITKFRDYVAEPKDDGYRALHLINRNHGRMIEVQLRTPNQDLWANTVETHARTIAPDLKFGGGPLVLREYFAAMGDLFARFDQNLPVTTEFFARIRELLVEADTFIEEAENESR